MSDDKIRVCTKCGLEQLLTEFTKDNRRQNGRTFQCRTCVNKANKQRMNSPEAKAIKAKQDRRYYESNKEKYRLNTKTLKAEGKAIIDSHKAGPCTDCGHFFPLEAMDLDHINGEKRLELSAMKCMNRTKIHDELAKCEPVCANCHRIRTEARRKPTKEKRLLAHRAMINEFKNRPCADCGKHFPPVAMDLDHVIGEKILEISNMGHYPRWKVQEELRKCEVVCVNCHRIRTETRRRNSSK